MLEKQHTEHESRCNENGEPYPHCICSPCTGTGYLVDDEGRLYECLLCSGMGVPLDEYGNHIHP